jgi:uncharacterized Fe-S radical SAM superfamily protein PflX
MAQYHPDYNAQYYPERSKTITTREYAVGVKKSEEAGAYR